MSTVSLRHGQLPAPFTSYTSPFFSRPLNRTPFLSLRRIQRRLRPTRSPPVEASFSSRLYKEEPVRVPGSEGAEEENPVLALLENKEPEEVARKRNWSQRGWAPWEELLSVESQFARLSLDEGVEVPLTTPEAIEAFKMLTPSYRKKKIAEIGEEEYLRRLAAFRGEIPEKLKTIWAGPMALRFVPPRDWPPEGWEVDKAELEFIREAHKLQSERVDIGGGENWIGFPGFEERAMEAFNKAKEILDPVFDQNEGLEEKFKEWAKANPDRLKMGDVRLMMKDDFLKEFKEFVSSNRGESSEEQDLGEVEKAVKKYEEFVKQFKEKDNVNAIQEASDTVNGMAFERYKVFLKQYTEWVEANRAKLEEESYMVMVKFY